MRIRTCLVAGLWALAGCGDGGGEGVPDPSQFPDAATTVDADPAPDADPLMPATLRDTGLYADFDEEVLADGVMEYEPEYPLWSDGATKRRFVLLPAGEQIDTADMDFWVYPEGTRLWKEFTRDGVRVETRLMLKAGPDPTDWYMVAYAWNEEQTEAVAVPGGASDVLGTDHDIPGVTDCRKCHSKTPDRALGFAAIQLDHDRGGLNLEQLVADGWLSDPPTGDAPYFDVPAAPGNVEAQDALGYLHANCGGCHHTESPVMDNVALDLRLYVGDLNNVNQTAVYRTAVDVEAELSAGSATEIVASGDPAASALRVRMADRGSIAMPPIGTESVDDTGLATIDAWITELAP